jgi:hypothetical protein
MDSNKLTDLVRSVTFMRQYQRQYFEARRLNQHKIATDLMRKAKGYEARVDGLLAEIAGTNTAQQELFR